MYDYYVTAWNVVDENGRPILEINEYMTDLEYRERVVGKYAVVSCSLLKAVSVSAIDAALEKEYQ